ncbi:SPOR domain-containing protein [Paraburkholderia sp. A1RI-2L]|uniref:SPOR domain-containing protein n=1 Tax=Paraburkholderia sp. A1RI-2L TaxID=3028367 RepID=UPI003B78FE58
MGIFSFGKKDDAPSRRDSEAGSRRRSSQNTRVERRSRRPARSGDAEAMLLDPTLPEKQRARRRLVGAIALVLAAIVILPMVLDSHPKPVTDDISIDIPGRPASKAEARHEDPQAGVAPDNPAAAEAGLGVATPGASGLSAASGAAPTQTAQAKPAAPARSAPAAQAQTQAQAQANQSAEAAQAPRTAAKPAAPSSGTAVASRGKTGNSAAANANAAEGDGAPPAPLGARFAVQLGAFSSEATANKWVTKLKAAGVPAYTEQRNEADGTTRTLLRAGPFPDRASATEAIAKVRGAGLMTGSNGSAQ